MTRRAIRLALAAACLMWQVEWVPVVAAFTAHAPAHTCSCWGTQACCCKGAGGQAGAGHDMCHLPEVSTQPTTADYLLEPVHCGDTPTAVAPGIHRDPFLLVSAGPMALPADALPAPAGAMGLASAPGVSDPPFVPPKRSRA